MPREREGKASGDSVAELKAAAAREVAGVREEALEQLQQAQVKLAAAHKAGETLQGRLEELQAANGLLHRQLADAHGKVVVHLAAGLTQPSFLAFASL